MLVDAMPQRLRPAHRHALPDSRRADAVEIERQAALVGRSPIVAALLDAVDAVLLVINPQRQVVAWNGPGADGVGPLGLRPGEVLGCMNAFAPTGCGTSHACESCGTLGAILGSERITRPVGADCVIPVEGGAARELDVRAAPIRLDGERFTVVTLRDVSAQKRREALEQIFFHDLLNTASGIRGWAWSLGRPGSDMRRAGERIEVLSRRLEREIRDQQALVLAEQGALVPNPAPVRPLDLVQEVAELFAQHPAARDRTLETADVEPGLTIETDPSLLVRVLVNMARNALEATAPGGTVVIGAQGGCDAAVRFSVHNAGVVPDEVRARVFQRSFSTKGPGRGLGTYGMKLIGERYLGGNVSFTSTLQSGTTFEIRLPARLAASAPPA